MKNKDKLKKIFKCLSVILLCISVMGLLIIVVIGLSLFGIIQEYKYLKIDDSNKKEIKTLLYNQESKMFNISKDFNLNKCVKTMKGLEVEFRFPDGEDYLIYCDNTKYKFSLDNTNYDLPKYMKENGKLKYRFK